MAKHSRKTPRKSKKAKKTPKKLVITNLKKLIQKEINKDSETKWATSVESTFGAINGGGILSTTNGLTTSDIIPSVVQGTGAGDRIGNVVSNAKLYIKVFLNSLAYDVVTNPNAFPCYVDMYIVSNKNSNDTTCPSTALLLREGSTTVAYDGSMLRTMDNINTNLWTLIKYKRFKMAVIGQPLATTTSADGMNNGSAISHLYKTTIKLPKLQYIDNSGDPTNKAIYILFGFTNINGNLQANTVQRATATVQTLMSFDDN